jgi:uncharacterized membrane protein YedE/YeeE
MNFADSAMALVGGALIGLAASLLWFTHGRIAGITGIAGSLLSADAKDRGMRVSFLIGLIAAGVIAALVSPSYLGATPLRSPHWLALAGLLVGFGTRLGNGCTSGHGVCGLSRLSKRSFVSTITFMGVAMITVFVVRAAGIQ